jgi:hypothetical protein
MGRKVKSAGGKKAIKAKLDWEFLFLSRHLRPTIRPLLIEIQAV